jgi:hypothetical protein
VRVVRLRSVNLTPCSASSKGYDVALATLPTAKMAPGLEHLASFTKRSTGLRDGVVPGLVHPAVVQARPSTKDHSCRGLHGVHAHVFVGPVSMQVG